MLKLPSRPMVLGLAAAGLVAVPSAAHAAAITLITDPAAAGCPRVGPDISTPALGVSGSGFAANEVVDFAFNGSAATSVASDAAGNVPPTQLPSPDLGTHNQATITLQAKGETSAATAATPAFPVVRPRVVLPDRGRPSSRVLYKVYGFANGQTVYAHYTFHGKQRAVKKLGAAKAPCGTLQKRLKFLPTTFRTGQWVYHFNNSKSNRNAQPLYEIKYQFSRVFRAPFAASTGTLGRALGF
jgi:hypothetical protein